MAVLVRHEPLNYEIDRLFGDLFSQSVARPQTFRPQVDLVEKDGHYLLQADLPGLSQEDISVEFEDGVLTVSGERKYEQADTKSDWRRLERRFGRFTRSIVLPKGTDPNTISASFANGVLEVVVRKPSESRRQQIAVTSPDGIETIEGPSANGSE
jgi:HSP20 family protein